MRPATTRFYKSEMWVFTPIQPPCQLHMLNTSETCAFSAHSFCSHPSTGHPHLSLVFLQDLSHQFLCLQSLSTHYFLYTVARGRFPKSNPTRSTTLYINKIHSWGFYSPLPSKILARFQKWTCVLCGIWGGRSSHSNKHSTPPPGL